MLIVFKRIGEIIDFVVIFVFVVAQQMHRHVVQRYAYAARDQLFGEVVAVFVDFVPFVDYYSPFSGPKAISIVVEPKDALTCRSSTLAVLADSGLFHRLLLTIFGVPKRSPWLSNSKVRLRVGHQESQFGPILARFLDYNSILGSRCHFHD